PDARAREARVPVGLRAEVIAGAGPAGRLAPPERPAGSVGTASEPGGGRGVEYADPAVLPAVQHHLGEDRQVARRGEEPGVTGDAAERVRVLVVYNAVDVRVAVDGVQLGGGDPCQDRQRAIRFGRRLAVAHAGGDGIRPRTGVVAGVPHAERIEDALVQEEVQRLARQLLDDEAQHHDAAVAVNGPAARRVIEAHAADAARVRVPAAQLAPERGVGRQPGGMHQQMADRDALLVPLAVPLVEVAGDRRIEVELALLDQDHRRGGRADDLGQRCQVVDRGVGDETEAAAPVEPAVAAQANEAAVTPDGQRGAGRRAGEDRVGDGRVGAGEPVRVHADLLRCGQHHAGTARLGRGRSGHGRDLPWRRGVVPLRRRRARDDQHRRAGGGTHGEAAQDHRLLPEALAGSIRRPVPSAWSGGIESGSLAVIGAAPVSARAAASWSTSWGPHASTYVPTSANCERTYGLPNEVTTVGHRSATRATNSATWGAMLMSPFDAMTRTNGEKRTASTPSAAARSESSCAGVVRASIDTARVPGRSLASVRWNVRPAIGS